MSIEFRDIGLRLTLKGDESFTHMVAYTPAEEPFVCMENYTCAPNAPNLYSLGKEEVSGLKVVAPGESIEGTVSFTIDDI